MRELPLLLNGPMVRAVLEGRKTVTRRIVKLPSESSLGLWEPTVVGGGSSTDRNGNACQEMTAIWHTRSGRTFAAPWRPGDRLWVREAWRSLDYLDDLSGSAMAEKCLEAGYRGPWAPIRYEADASLRDWMHVGTPPRQKGPTPGRYRHARFMPRWASRINLEVTSVRVERLQDGEGEMDRESRYLAEGINRIHHGDGAYYYSAIRNEPHPQNWTDPFDAWRELWLSTGGDWDANPWVWVVEFKRIEQERKIV